MKGSVWSNWDPREGQQPFRSTPNGVGNRTTMLRRLLIGPDWCTVSCFMLPSTSCREALLACPPFPPWNLPSFTMESTLSSPCSRSDPPLSRLLIWYSGQTALLLFLLDKAAPAFLPTALSVALRPLFPFRQAQYVQVFPLKPASFCTLFAGLGSTKKSAISFPFSSPTI